MVTIKAHSDQYLKTSKEKSTLEDDPWDYTSYEYFKANENEVIDAKVSTQEDTYQYASKSVVVEESELKDYLSDQTKADEAAELLDIKLSGLSVYEYFQKSGLAVVFNNSMATDANWEVFENGDNYTLLAKTIVTASTSVTVHEYSLTINADCLPTFGFSSSTKYATADFDTTTNTPVEDAEPQEVKGSSISTVVFGDKTAATTDLFDTSPYFVTSIDAELFSAYWDETINQAVYSNANELFVGSDIYVDEEGILAFEPTTACNLDSLTITSSDNPAAVYFDEQYNCWMAGETANEWATVTIGNASNPNMLRLDVKTVELPTSESGSEGGSSAPNFDYEAEPMVLIGSGTFDSMNGQLNVTGSVGSSITFILFTTNAGPFTTLADDGYTTISTNTGVVTAQFVEDQATTVGGIGMAYCVVVELVIQGEGTSIFGVLKNGEPVHSFGISVVLS